jgi:hypothetical protein
MTQEEMLIIADKIKRKVATEDEILAFAQEYSKLLGEIKDELAKE